MKSISKKGFYLFVMFVVLCLEHSYGSGEIDNYADEPALRNHKIQIESTRKDIIEIFSFESSESLPRWKSKFGGFPFLPKTISYPTTALGKPLHFLAQLNFAEIPFLDPFPATGILQIYIENNPGCGAYNGIDSYKLIYIPEVSGDEEQHDPSVFPIADKYFPIKEGKELRLEFKRGKMLIPPEDYRFETVFKDILSNPDYGEEFEERYVDWYFEGGGTANASHWIGGYPAFDQDNDPRSEEDEKDTLLFHMGSDHPSVLNWGEGGQSNFFIDEDKLRALDFSNVWYMWDAS